MGKACRTYWKRTGAYRVFVGKHERRGSLGRTNRRWRIILKWIFEKRDGRARTGSIWLRIGTDSGQF
jgi:hypothetical protein